MREGKLLNSLNLFFNHFCDRAHLNNIAEGKQAYKQIKELIKVDVEEIIQAVLNHTECHHVPTHDEDGHHENIEYDVDDKCHEAVRKVLGVEK